ncbi:hypothetical protein ACTJNA_00080 [Klebsiella pneumoniae]
MPENIVSTVIDEGSFVCDFVCFLAGRRWLVSHPDSGNITKKILGKEKN